MLSPKIKWNDPSVNKQIPHSVNTSFNQKHQRFGSNSRQRNDLKYKKQCVALINLKKNLLQQTRLYTQSHHNNHNVTYDIKKIKKGFQYQSSHKQYSNNFMCKNVRNILQQTKTILKTIHLLLKQIKYFYNNIKTQSLKSIQMFLEKTQYKIAQFSNVKNVQSISLIKKNDISDKKTTLPSFEHQSNIKAYTQCLQTPKQYYKIQHLQNKGFSHKTQKKQQKNSNSMRMATSPQQKNNYKQFCVSQSKQITNNLKQRIYQLNRKARMLQD